MKNKQNEKQKDIAEIFDQYAYYVTLEDLKRHSTLSKKDIGKKYIILCGCIQFIN